MPGKARSRRKAGCLSSERNAVRRINAKPRRAGLRRTLDVVAALVKESNP